MNTKHPIVVYGVTGYTGKLIAEFLTKRGLPFVAAGRSRDKIAAELATVPGDHQVQIEAVSHDETGLKNLLAGAKLVINVVGPFGQLGEPVVKAALETGCHYIDTTGEQDWTVLLRDKYHEAFAKKGLLLSPGCSFMWTAGMIAAEIALEDPTVDSLDILYAPQSAPTVASTLSFLRMLCLPNPLKQYGSMTAWPANTVVDVAVPGSHVIHAGLPWGGGFEPIWLEREQGVLNCSVLVAFPKGPLVDFVVARMKEYSELAKTKSPQELEDVTNAWGMSIATTPVREVPKINQTMISVWARGTTGGKQILLHVTSPYLTTGALSAIAAERILKGKLLGVGFQPATRAFGHRQLMAGLAEEGLHCWSEQVR
ncbi:saccharopine dehydrogenase family protein [Cupriavidus sp. a3]|uniref:saccharopine dehydrogenase family protein n=1 Tax=Cupriavidus sp. a3 TaxID=3242158 RepID=UPI003D9C085D